MTQHGQPNARTGCPKPQDTLQAPTKGDRAPKPCPQFHHSTKTPGQCPKPNPPKGFIPPPSLPPSLSTSCPDTGTTPPLPRTQEKGQGKGHLGTIPPFPTPQRWQGGGHGGTPNPRRAERPFPPIPGGYLPSASGCPCRAGTPPLPAQGTRDQRGAGPGGNSGTRGRYLAMFFYFQFLR